MALRILMSVLMSIGLMPVTSIGVIVVFFLGTGGGDCGRLVGAGVPMLSTDVTTASKRPRAQASSAER